MKNLLSVISEKLVINKNSKVKSLDNIKQIYWAALYNILCYLYLDTKFIYELRDTTNNDGDIYYVSFNINRNNIHLKQNWENRTFFKETRKNVEPIKFDNRSQLSKAISKNINKQVSKIHIFSVKNHFNSLVLGILLYISNNDEKDLENIIYLVSANKDDLNEITKTFIETDNWEIYDKNISKALY